VDQPQRSGALVFQPLDGESPTPSSTKASQGACERGIARCLDPARRPCNLMSAGKGGYPRDQREIDMISVMSPGNQLKSLITVTIRKEGP
jgi:hypothetical protein